MRALAAKVKTKNSAYVLAAAVFLLSFAVPSLFWPAKVDAAIAARSATGTAGNNGGGATSVTVTKPTAEQGDMIIVTVVALGNPTISSSGWTSVVRTTGGTAMVQETFWKQAGTATGDAGPYIFTLGSTQKAAWGAMAYSAVHDGSPMNPINVSGGTQATSCNTITAPSVTPTVDNGMLIASVGMYQGGALGSGSMTTVPPSGMTERYDNSSANILATNVAIESSDLLGSTNGTPTGNKIADNTDGMTNCTGQQILLKPALYNFSQSAYRWFGNKDTLDGIAATSNATSGDDKSSSIALDAANGVIYTAGYEGVSSDNRWRIEKRLVSDGSLVSAFGGSGCTTNRGGAVCSDPTTGDDQILDIAIDTAGGFLYAAGYDSTGSNRWRVEKRSLGDGSLATGTTSGGFVAGILVLDPNPSLNDQIYAVSLDISGGAMFLGGRDGGGNGQWRLEKRTMSTGVYVSAFGTGGVLTNDISAGGSKDEFIYDLALDPGSGVMYAAGFDGQPSGANAFKWRVEKYSMTTGALGTNFGGSAPCTTDGIYCLDTNTSGGASDDRATTLALDSSYLFIAGIDSSNGGQWRVARITLSSNTISSSLVAQNVAGSSEESIKGILSDGSNIYLAGYDNAGSDGAGGSSYRWRIEKRTVAGALVSAFGTAGVVTSDPTVASDQSTGAAIDTANGFIYANGFDANGSNRWRVERRSTVDGSSGWALQTLAAQDTLASPDDLAIVRLRLLMHNNTATLWGTDPAQSFKIQYSPKSGTCDTAYIGEVFSDLTSSGTDLRFYDNSSGDTGDNTAVIPGDPAHGSDVSKLQAYVESNNFNNNGTIKVTEDGLWDVAIQELAAYGGYCFKVVKSDGTDISVPTQVPEIEYCAKPRETDVLRGGGYFCNGSERRFFWSL
ncbi:MAG: hypothetical protein ACR2FM_05755 [Candidatus Saccharimonadales bacterium]